MLELQAAVYSCNLPFRRCGPHATGCLLTLDFIEVMAQFIMGNQVCDCKMNHYAELSGMIIYSRLNFLSVRFPW